MSWKCYVHFEPATRQNHIYMEQEPPHADGRYAFDGESVEFVASCCASKPMLRLDHDMTKALLEGLAAEHALPPTNDDLRDALDVERDRVDRVLTMLLMKDAP